MDSNTSIEKDIHGHHDSGHHEGRYSELKRIAETDDQIINFWIEVWPELVEAFSKGELEDDDVKDTDEPIQSSTHTS